MIEDMDKLSRRIIDPTFSNVAKVHGLMIL